MEDWFRFRPGLPSRAQLTKRKCANRMRNHWWTWWTSVWWVTAQNHWGPRKVKTTIRLIDSETIGFWWRSVWSGSGGDSKSHCGRQVLSWANNTPHPQCFSHRKICGSFLEQFFNNFVSFSHHVHCRILLLFPMAILAFSSNLPLLPLAMDRNPVLFNNTPKVTCHFLH